MGHSRGTIRLRASVVLDFYESGRGGLTSSIAAPLTDHCIPKDRTG